MIVTLGDIIIDRLDELPFMDKFAGIIRVLTYKEQGPNNTFIRKSFPADCKISLDECKKNNRYLDLCPDSKKKSVIYLEDNGIRPERIEGDWVYWVASIDLIAWLNLPLLGAETCSYSSIAMQGIFSKILIPQFNYENFNYVTINVSGIKPKSVNPFLKYSYDETVNQFLMYPYDYFVLQLEVKFRMNKKCFKVEDLNSPIDCLVK